MGLGAVVAGCSFTTRRKIILIKGAVHETCAGRLSVYCYRSPLLSWLVGVYTGKEGL